MSYRPSRPPKQRITPACEFERQVEMLVDIDDPETERGHGKKAIAITEEFADMKQHLVDASLDPRTCRNRMIEHAVRRQPPLGDARPFGLDPPDLDTQALSRAPARDIDRMNGNSPCHFVFPLMSVPA
jgi:hypothetical protein